MRLQSTCSEVYTGIGEEEDDIDPFEEIKKEEYRHLLVHIVSVCIGSRTGILAIHFTLIYVDHLHVRLVAATTIRKWRLLRLALAHVQLLFKV